MEKTNKKLQPLPVPNVYTYNEPHVKSTNEYPCRAFEILPAVIRNEEMDER